MNDHFQEKFIEEAKELVSGLEEALLVLEDNPDDTKRVEEVFRVMHTLKGSGAMFGMNEISEFTHNLESLYVYVKEQQIPVTKQLLDLTLDSVDHIKVLLSLEMDEETISNGLELSWKLLQHIENAGIKVLPDSESSDIFPVKKREHTKIIIQQKSPATFYILFKPGKDILRDGTNPLYLLDELSTMGSTYIFRHSDAVPLFKEIDPVLCYAFWEILMVTGNDIDDIRDVFLFVEDVSIIEIQKISDNNMLDNNDFVRKVESLYTEGKTMNQATLKYISEEFVVSPDKLPVEPVTNAVIPVSEPENTKDPQPETNAGKGIPSIRVSSDKVDNLMNNISELVIVQAQLSLLADKINQPDLSQISESVEKLSRQLRDNVFDISLVPVKNLVARYKRLIRDLSKELGKEIDFFTDGTETALDKNIIESLTDPLLHIFRNSIDHGIEDPEIRKERGKPAKGKITLKAYYSGSEVHIAVEDDGGGIDIDKIKEKAIEKGIIKVDASPGRNELLNLIFHSGFSTASKVTGVSGRGVGMDVVMRKIKDVRGNVEIDTEVGKGTTITIKLPLTLSIIDGLMVSVADSFYVLPISVVDKIYPVKHKELQDSFNNIIVLDGEQIQFIYLRDEFIIDGEAPVYEQVVVVRYGERKVGLVVDTVIREYQAVLKPVGSHYKDQDFFSGATILGDGSIALILDTNRIVSRFTNEEHRANQEPELVTRNS